MLESVKDLVTDANFDCAPTGFSLQAMDASHVSLVALLLRCDGFDHYRCDRSLSMGMNLANMARPRPERFPTLPARCRTGAPRRAGVGEHQAAAPCRWPGRRAGAARGG